MKEHQPLRVALIADVHYVNAADHVCPVPERHASLGREFVQRVVNRLRRLESVDAIVLLGDLVDNGLASGVELDLNDLKMEVEKAGVPVLVVPGNHGANAERLLQLFGDRAGVHEVNGYRLTTFADEYASGDYCTRSRRDLEELRAASDGRPHDSLVAFQHNPVYPPIESSYPYNLTNAAEVMEAYRQSGVALSVSGHYHEGLPVCEQDGVRYLISPALCEAPFRFLTVTLDGREVAVEEHALKMGAASGIVDVHAHTEYAYCGDGVDARTSVAKSKLLGLGGVTLTEHSGQLYCSPEDFWSTRFLNEPSLIRRQRATGLDRMPRYLREMRALRSEDPGFIRLALEVELNIEGKLTLLDEDREHFDLLVGAVHWLPDNVDAATRAATLKGFMQVTEGLVTSGIDVLAHPFRYFRRSSDAASTELYRPVAQLLAAHVVAAEVNYHTNEPEVEFFAMCLEEGVKIAFGSDSHSPEEVGEFFPHLQLLKRAGAPGDLSGVLYRPTAEGTDFG